MCLPQPLNLSLVIIAILARLIANCLVHIDPILAISQIDYRGRSFVQCDNRASFTITIWRAAYTLHWCSYYLLLNLTQHRLPSVVSVLCKEPGPNHSVSVIIVLKRARTLFFCGLVISIWDCVAERKICLFYSLVTIGRLLYVFGATSLGPKKAFQHQIT